jgi:hypothetical protein
MVKSEICVTKQRSAKIMKQILLLLACLIAFWIGISAAARHAYLLPGYGSVLNLFFPPDDVWAPLASTQVQKGVRNYSFTVSHKYPGNHHLKISIPRQKGLELLPVELSVTLEIEQGGKIFMKRSGAGSSFWGIDRQGVEFCRYSFPVDVSSREKVVCHVLIEGDVDLLLDRYGDVVVSIAKGSDK